MSHARARGHPAGTMRNGTTRKEGAAIRSKAADGGLSIHVLDLDVTDAERSAGGCTGKIWLRSARVGV